MAIDGTLLLYWVIWLLPAYFQGIPGNSPLETGVNQLSLNIFLMPSGIVAGGMISKTEKYKPQHFVGFALASIGVGLFTLLDAGSHKAAWVYVQIIAAIDLGIILVAVFPAVQTALSHGDAARTTATYAFVRSFGGIWSVTIPFVNFNGRVKKLLHRIGNAAIREQLSNVNVYDFPSTGGLLNVKPPTRDKALGVYSDALKIVCTGAVTSAVFETYPELVSSLAKTTTYAIETNSDYIADFERQVTSLGWNSTVMTEVMPVEDLLLPPSTVTYSFNNLLIFNTRDLQKVAAEVLHSLAPRGVAVMTPWATLPHAKALDRTRARLYGEVYPHIKPR
ncbi:hypothetical protein N0V90_001592 [Kalmusia sp. IMI 367209]|nr:hypothetical protein N0V90_001592 [Kalmusia sp. IMI 367209]